MTSHKRNTMKKIYLIFPILSGILFGSSGIFVRTLTQNGIDATTLLFLRFSIAILVLLIAILATDKELLKMHGDYGTFIIRVQQRQGGTWQGRITWADRNKTVHFRSILEMIKLIEDGIIAEHPELLEEEETPHWDE